MHKGSVDDGYICSSKHMMPEYKVRPDDFTRQIIATGTLNDCRALEIALLKKIVLDKNTCYNKVAGKFIVMSEDTRERWRQAKLCGLIDFEPFPPALDGALQRSDRRWDLAEALARGRRCDSVSS